MHSLRSQSTTEAPPPPTLTSTSPATSSASAAAHLKIAPTGPEKTIKARSLLFVKLPPLKRESCERLGRFQEEEDEVRKLRVFGKGAIWTVRWGSTGGIETVGWGSGDGHVGWWGPCQSTESRGAELTYPLHLAVERATATGGAVVSTWRVLIGHDSLFSC